MPNFLPLFSKTWGLDASTENKGLISREAVACFLSPSWCRASGNTLESGICKSNWFKKIVLCGDRAGRWGKQQQEDGHDSPRSRPVANWREHGKRKASTGTHWICSVWKVIKIIVTENINWRQGHKPCKNTVFCRWTCLQDIQKLRGPP